MTDTLKLEQYDFVSFCQDMFNAFKQGYEPVWTSDDSPQQIGFCFHAVLHKVECEPVVNWNKFSKGETGIYLNRVNKC